MFFRISFQKFFISSTDFGAHNTENLKNLFFVNLASTSRIFGSIYMLYFFED